MKGKEEKEGKEKKKIEEISRKKMIRFKLKAHGSLVVIHDKVKALSNS